MAGQVTETALINPTQTPDYLRMETLKLGPNLDELYFRARLSISPVKLYFIKQTSDPLGQNHHAHTAPD